MRDYSIAVPWVTALLGGIVSYGIARLTSRTPSISTALLAGAKAFALSLASLFIGSLLHGLCIDTLHRCSTHGEGNIKYAMGGVLAFPLFWIIIAAFGKSSND